MLESGLHRRHRLSVTLNVMFICSACLLPPADYPLWDAICDDIVDRGLLSQLQLEGVLYATMKHLQWLPNGQREWPGARLCGR